MQPNDQLIRDLRKLAANEGRVFSLSDLRALLPTHQGGAFKSIITRLEKKEELDRVCRGIYMLPEAPLRGSDLLGHTAARLRASYFNYLSLETVLSDTGIISQVPVNRITLMSSGRTNVISCGKYGSIEFVHTRKKAGRLGSNLSYDNQYGLWRASCAQALQDMHDTGRDTGLINPEAAHESF
jgi:predicted transcriptional regulator of viral defense system